MLVFGGRRTAGAAWNCNHADAGRKSASVLAIMQESRPNMEYRAPNFAPLPANQSNRDVPGDGGWLRRWRTLLIVAGAAVVGALIFGWFGLFAAAIPPLLLSVLPCVVMCALGLCMAGRREKACRKPMDVDAGKTEMVPPSAENQTTKG